MSEPQDAGAAAQHELLRKWQELGDVDALDELLRSEIQALAAALRQRARNALRPSASASDLAQEAIYRMLRLEEPPRFEHPRELRAYLWHAAWRLLVDRMRGRSRSIVSLSEAETRELDRVLRTSGSGHDAEREERRDALNVVIHLLRPEDREVLDLVYFRHLAIEDAARELGITRAACDMRLSRARRRLAERMLRWADVLEPAGL